MDTSLKEKFLNERQKHKANPKVKRSDCYLIGAKKIKKKCRPLNNLRKYNIYAPSYAIKGIIKIHGLRTVGSMRKMEQNTIGEITTNL